MVEALSIFSAFERLCKETKKWGMYISITCFDDSVREEPEKAALYLDWDNEEHTQIMCNGSGFFLFDTEGEMEEYYQQTVGDDGPTKLNSYNGNTRIYALTCGPDGQTLNENT
jgi:hypothetical protein